MRSARACARSAAGAEPEAGRFCADAENVDLPGVLSAIRAAFGSECLPINLPADGGKRVVDCFFNPAGEADFSSVAEAHQALVDQVVEVDEALMSLYLEQGEIAPDQLHAPFEKALRDGHLVPVCFVSARTGAGVGELLDEALELGGEQGQVAAENRREVGEACGRFILAERRPGGLLIGDNAFLFGVGARYARFTQSYSATRINQGGTNGVLNVALDQQDLDISNRFEGWGPTVMHVGSRTLISYEAAERWRRAWRIRAIT